MIFKIVNLENKTSVYMEVDDNYSRIGDVVNLGGVRIVLPPVVDLDITVDWLRIKAGSIVYMIGGNRGLMNQILVDLRDDYIDKTMVFEHDGVEHRIDTQMFKDLESMYRRDVIGAEQLKSYLFIREKLDAPTKIEYNGVYLTIYGPDGDKLKQLLSEDVSDIRSFDE